MYKHVKSVLAADIWIGDMWEKWTLQAFQMASRCQLCQMCKSLAVRKQCCFLHFDIRWWTEWIGADIHWEWDLGKKGRYRKLCRQPTYRLTFRKYRKECTLSVQHTGRWSLCILYIGSITRNALYLYNTLVCRRYLSRGIDTTCT